LERRNADQPDNGVYFHLRVVRGPVGPHPLTGETTGYFAEWVGIGGAFGDNLLQTGIVGEVIELGGYAAFYPVVFTQWWPNDAAYPNLGFPLR